MGILLMIHVFVTIFLILIVLIQKNEGGSSLFASGSASSGGLMTARGAANVITKATWISATIFLGNCILMAALDSSAVREKETIIASKKFPEKIAKSDGSSDVQLGAKSGSHVEKKEKA